MKRTRFHDERGATAVLMAFCMVGLLAFGGLVLDGGNAFSQRRQMQNSADASATAGANALYRYKLNTSLPTTSINAAALQVAQDNSANPATFTCELVLYNNQTELPGTVPCLTATPTQLSQAWKVRVKVNATSPTTLMKVVKINSFTAKAGAAASLLEGSGAASAFMVCGAPGSETPNLLLADSTDPTGWRINPAAINQIYDVWGNAVKASDCGYKGSSFRGLVDDESFHAIPGTWPADSGNKGGNKLAGDGSAFVGGCDLTGVKVHSIPDGCEMALPICVSPGADKKSLYCVAIGRFKIVSHSSTNAKAMFLGAGVLSTGPGGNIPTGTNAALVIKLTE